MEAVRLISHTQFPPPSCLGKKLSPSSSSSSSSLCLSNSHAFRQQRRIGGGLLCARAATAEGLDNGNKKKGVVNNTNYVVPLENPSPPFSSCITRPLVEILRDLNKRVPDKIVRTTDDDESGNQASYIPWYHANRMLSFHAPGWCGEIRSVLFSDDGNVTVIYRLTIRGSDGEAYRESCGTVSIKDKVDDHVKKAEEIAFCRACARFGLGLYLYHEDESQ